jgi:hypothetical protein
MLPLFLSGLLATSALASMVPRDVAVRQVSDPPPAPTLTDCPPLTTTWPAIWTINCGNIFCKDCVRYCFYQPPVTGADANGPLPRMTTAAMGTCDGASFPPAAAPTTIAERQETITEPPPPPPMTTESVECHYKYCDNGTEWCVYWGGVTGWDPSKGPVPGMTRTSLSGCPIVVTEAVVDTTTTTFVTSTITVPA